MSERKQTFIGNVTGGSINFGDNSTIVNVTNGNRVFVTDNEVLVDGKIHTAFKPNTSITINVTSPTLETIRTQSGNVVVTGSVGGDVATVTGSVEVKGDVGKNIFSESGSITCMNVRVKS